MVKIGVLQKLKWNNNSPWASSNFNMPTKMHDIRIMKDFWKMNKVLKWHLFPLPRIIKTLQKLEKFNLTTALDLFKGIYMIPLHKGGKAIYQGSTVGKMRV